MLFHQTFSGVYLDFLRIFYLRNLVVDPGNLPFEVLQLRHKPLFHRRLVFLPTLGRQSSDQSNGTPDSFGSLMRIS